MLQPDYRLSRLGTIDAGYPTFLIQLDAVVHRMERAGVYVDKELAREKLAAAEKQLADVDAALSQWLPPDVNLNSPMQAIAFFDSVGLPRAQYWFKGRVRDGEAKLDTTAVKWIQSQVRGTTWELFLDFYIERKRVLKAIQYLSYIDYAASDGRIHPVIGAIGESDDRSGTASGRFSIKNPAMQQLPANKEKDLFKVREIFTAPEGRSLVVCDWSALEVRTLAHVAKFLFSDDTLERRIAPGAPDIHSATARYVYGEFMGDHEVAACPVDQIKKRYDMLRQNVKAIRYGLAYCKGARGFGETLFDESGEAIGEQRAQVLVDGLLSFDPAIKHFQDWVWKYIRNHGEMPSIFGKIRPLPDALSREEWQVRRAWRQACNHPQQGGGAEIAGSAMIEIDAALRDIDPTARLTLQIHDELIAECQEEKAEAVRDKMHEIMCHPRLHLNVPLEASAGTGKNWLEAK